MHVFVFISGVRPVQVEAREPEMCFGGVGVVARPCIHELILCSLEKIASVRRFHLVSCPMDSLGAGIPAPDGAPFAYGEFGLRSAP